MTKELTDWEEVKMLLHRLGYTSDKEEVSTLSELVIEKFDDALIARENYLRGEIEKMKRVYDYENGVHRWAHMKDMWGEEYAKHVNDKTEAFNTALDAIANLYTEAREGMRQECLAALPREYITYGGSEDAPQRAMGWLEHLKESRTAISNITT